MKIEIKELVGYLPYGLKMKVNDVQFYRYEIMTLCDKTGLSNIGISDVIDEPQDFKPILRPLSDLTKEIEHNGERFVPVDVLCPKESYLTEYERKVDICRLEMQGAIRFSYSAFCIVQQLYEWHFDLYDWIERGLAIDINTLNHA